MGLAKYPGNARKDAQVFGRKVWRQAAKPGIAGQLEQGLCPMVWLAEYEKPGSSRHHAALGGCAMEQESLPQAFSRII